jgi:hypothetical protein
MIIPQTLVEAKEVAQMRGFEWDERYVEIVQGILDAGREVDVMGKVDEFAIRISELASANDDCRAMSAIAKIAVALGARVRNYQ